MKELEKYKPELIGQKLIKVFHTDQGEGIEYLNGLGNAYHFSTILELENNKKYQFGNDWIEIWEDSAELKEVTHKNWEVKRNIKFNNIGISDLIVGENNDVYIKLENDVLIYHTIDYGDKLFFDKYKNIFDSNGKFIKNTTYKPSFWSKLKSIWS